MLIIFLRFFLRLLILIVWVLSIFFFYVFWYIYNTKRWFIKTSWVFDIRYFSNDNFKKNIIINSNKYYVVDNKLTLYWLEDGECWILKIWDYQKYYCYDWKKYSYVLYIKNFFIKKYPITKNIIFSQLNLETSHDYDISYTFVWNDIKFYYYKDWSLIYKDDISYKKLTTIKWAEFVWYNKKGFFFILNEELYFIQILDYL